MAKASPAPNPLANPRPGSWMFILNAWLAVLLFLGVLLLGSTIWFSVRTSYDRVLVERQSVLLANLVKLRDGLLDWHIDMAESAAPMSTAPADLWQAWKTADVLRSESWPQGTYPDDALATLMESMEGQIEAITAAAMAVDGLPAAARRVGLGELALRVVRAAQGVNETAATLRQDFFQFSEQRDPHRVLFPIMAFTSCLLVAVLMVISTLYRRDLAKLEERSQALSLANNALAAEVRSRQLAQSSLARQEESYRRFFEESLSANYISSPSGELLACNRVFASIFGFASVDEALKGNLNDLYPVQPDRLSFIERIQREGKIEGLEAELRRRDGKPIFVIENVIGEFDERGRLTKIRGYLIDNTRRRLLEQQLVQAGKLDAVGRVTSGIAHDFNNMLTAILGYSNMLLDEVRPDQTNVREGLIEIIKASERSAGLVRRLLAFSRSQVVMPRLLELNAIVQDLEKLMRLLLGEHIVIELDLDAQVGQVRADPTQLESVILNMALNARDAMPMGGTLTLRTSISRAPSHADLSPQTPASAREETPLDGYSVLSVIDTGQGMDDHVRAHLFEPFFTTKAPGQGTGLGLASAAEIIRKSQGFIQVESASGRGTEFRIFLPRVPGGQPIEAKPRVSAAPPVRSGNGRTVLLVEDEESVRSFAERVLTLAGYRVLTAAHGQEARELASKLDEPIHALVTDVVMPHLNGPDLARELVTSRPDLKVLFMTGYAKETGSRFLPSLKFNQDLIRKPFTPEALADKLESLFLTRTARKLTTWSSSSISIGSG
ncbi:MAG TPA: response regulator [Gemmatales bacterium]|nr:response regulator [Gemmatales bacterium]HMP60173.1 response regulator [Gemmatales bacterium]